MKVKISNMIWDSEKEAIMIILSKQEIEDIAELDSDGIVEAKYLLYPEDKYSETHIKEFRILPEERIDTENKRREEVRLKKDEEEKIRDEKQAEKEREEEEIRKEEIRKGRSLTPEELSAKANEDKDTTTDEKEEEIEEDSGIVTKKDSDAAAELIGEESSKSDSPPEREISEMPEDSEMKLG